MTHTYFTTLLSGALVLTLCGSSAWAKLPPGAAKRRKASTYAKARALQRKAPEVVRIQVRSVQVKEFRTKRRRCVHQRRYVVKATILHVTRSRSGLRKGQRLNFSYSRDFQCRPGPTKYTPLALSRGDVSTVFLSHERGSRGRKARFRIAASVLSIVRGIYKPARQADPPPAPKKVRD